jgi:hypothetical protein
MRSVGAEAEDRTVTVAPPRRVVVVLEPTAGPISGSVEGPDGVRRGFAGWLELCALLEAARATAGDPPHQEAV